MSMWRPCNCHPLKIEQIYLHKISFWVTNWFLWVGHLPGGCVFANDVEVRPMPYSSYFFPLVFINKCKQIKSCLGDLCHMFRLKRRERPDCLRPIFTFGWLPALQFGVHFVGIILKALYLSWGEFAFIVDFNSNGFKQVFFTLIYRSIRYLLILSSWCFFHTFVHIPSVISESCRVYL